MTVTVHWIPLGAGGRTVPVCGRAYERLAAAWARRPPQALVHAALTITEPACTVEMAPAWSPVVGEPRTCVDGPVGMRILGHFTLFRYQIRCLADGRIPDLSYAVASTSLTPPQAQVDRLLAAVADVPRFVWGRRAGTTSEMWNSNSVVAWLLTTSAIALPTDFGPPTGYRAPGWTAGRLIADGSGITPPTTGFQACRQWRRPQP